MSAESNSKTTINDLKPDLTQLWLDTVEQVEMEVSMEVEKMDNNRSFYSCPGCALRFWSLAGALEHGKNTGCPLCQRRYPPTLENSDAENMRRADTNGVEAEVISRVLRSKKPHENAVREDKQPYVCSDCSSAFSTESHLNEHRRRKVCLRRKLYSTHTNNGTERSRQPVSCPRCSEMFYNSYNLARHLKRKVCAQAESTSQQFNEWELNTHSEDFNLLPLQLKTEPLDLKVDVGQVPLRCLYCFQSFDAVELFNKHTEICEDSNLASHSYSDERITMDQHPPTLQVEGETLPLIDFSPMVVLYDIYGKYSGAQFGSREGEILVEDSGTPKQRPEVSSLAFNDDELGELVEDSGILNQNPEVSTLAFNDDDIEDLVKYSGTAEHKPEVSSLAFIDDELEDLVEHSNRSNLSKDTESLLEKSTFLKEEPTTSFSEKPGSGVIHLSGGDSDPGLQVDVFSDDDNDLGLKIDVCSDNETLVSPASPAPSTVSGVVLEKGSQNESEQDNGEFTELLQPYFCKFCDIELMTLACHQYHFKLKHYHCYRCKIWIENREKFEEHSIEVHNSVICLACDKAGSENLIKKHIKMTHIDKATGLFLCKECSGTRLIPPEDIVNHIKEHQKNLTFTCRVCQHITYNENDFLLHRVTKHQNMSPQISYRCLACEGRFLEPHGLRKHLLVFCRSVSSFCFNCLLASRSDVTSDQLHNNESCLEKPNPKINYFKREESNICHTCWQPVKGSLKEHCDQEHRHKTFQCSVCGQRFEFSHQLDFHKKIHKPKNRAMSICSKCTAICESNRASITICDCCKHYFQFESTDLKLRVKQLLSDNSGLISRKDYSVAIMSARNK